MKDESGWSQIQSVGLLPVANVSRPRADDHTNPGLPHAPSMRMKNVGRLTRPMIPITRSPRTSTRSVAMLGYALFSLCCFGPSLGLVLVLVLAFAALGCSCSWYLFLLSPVLGVALLFLGLLFPRRPSFGLFYLVGVANVKGLTFSVRISIKSFEDLFPAFDGDQAGKFCRL